MELKPEEVQANITRSIYFDANKDPSLLKDYALKEYDA